MQLESIKSSHKLTQTAVYSYPVTVQWVDNNNILALILYVVCHVSLADHLRHLPIGQVTEIIGMFCSNLQDDLPSETSNDDSTSNGE